MKPRLCMAAIVIAVGASVSSSTVMAQHSGSFEPLGSQFSISETAEGMFRDLRLDTFSNAFTGFETDGSGRDRNRRSQFIRSISVAFEIAEFGRNLLIIGILRNSRDGIVRASGLF